MPPGDEYSTGGGGKLKLKGSKVSDGRVEKKKAKKAKKEKESVGTASGGEVVPTEGTTPEDGGEKSREDEYGSETGTGTVGVGKTETERKYEEIRRKRMQERLRRDGFKTHKERVEELNKYLSGLTEHHDMPKIGPG